MKKIIVIPVFFFMAFVSIYPATLAVKVTDGRVPVEDASLAIPELKLNLISDNKGFCIINFQ